MSVRRWWYVAGVLSAILFSQPVSGQELPPPDIENLGGEEPPCEEDCEPVPEYAVSVTPDGGNVTVWAPAVDTVQFMVSNTGTGLLELEFGCGEATVTCETVSPASATVAASSFTTVSVIYSVATPTTGIRMLSLNAVAPEASDEGYYNVSVRDTLTAPLVDVAPHNGTNVDVTRCALDCLHGTLAYSTPAYYSFDTPRSVTLLYRSEQAVPRPVVQLTVQDTSAEPATAISIRLKRNFGDLGFETLTDGTSEIFYSRHTSGTNRIAAQIRADTLPTGAYSYTAYVRSYWKAGVFRERTVGVTVLVVNERNSPFGLGWSLAGLQRLHVPANGPQGRLLTDGTGSARFFAGACAYGASNCAFTSPTGDFSALTYNGTDSRFYRTFQDGTRVSFHSDGRMEYVRDRFGSQTSYAWTGSQLDSIIDPAGKAITFAYASGSLAAIESADGRISYVDIDPVSGELTGIEDPSGGMAIQNLEYDADHRLTSYQDRRGAEWTMAYDVTSRLERVTAPATEIDNDPGQVASVSTDFFAGERRLLVNQGTSSFSNPKGARTAVAWRHEVTDPDSVTTRFTLDRWRQATQVIDALGTPLARTSTFTFNASGLPLTAVTPTGVGMTWTWSGAQLTSVHDDETDQTVHYEYDATRFYALDRVYGDAIPETEYSLDSLGLPDAVWIVGKLLPDRTTFTYDAFGRMLTSTDPEGHQTTWSYQPTGFRNLASVTAPDGGVTTYAYDGMGRDTAVIAPGGYAWITHDVLNRVTFTRHGDDRTTYTYDDVYNQLVVTDDRGNEHTFQYDALGRLDWQEDPLGGLTQYGYDLTGRVGSVGLRGGPALTFDYDTLGVLRSRHQSAEGVTTSFYTSADGQLVVANVPGVSVDSLRYDDLGRPTSAISRRNGRRFRTLYSYDTDGRLLRVSFRSPTGDTDSTTYHWYDSGQLNRLFAHQIIESTELGYNADYQLSADTNHVNDVVTERAYPSTHRNAELTFRNPQGAWDADLNSAFGRGWEQDEAGRTVKRWFGFHAEAETDSVWHYEYDDEGHLETAERFLVSCASQLQFDQDEGWHSTCSGSYFSLLTYVVYNPDDLGNNSAGGMIYGDNNRLLSSAGGWTYEYDDAGKLTAKKLNGVVQASYVWNSLGQLTSVIDETNADTTHFAYDGFGQRVRRVSAAGDTTHYVYDRGNLIAETTRTGALIRSYSYYPGGLDNVHSMRDHALDSTFYYVRETPNHVIGLIDENGDVANRYDYLPYGGLRVIDERVDNPLRFAAREWDEDAGLYYMRARWYDPAMQRFISEDPIGINGGGNLYAFAGSNPVGKTDPSGLSASNPDWCFGPMGPDGSPVCEGYEPIHVIVMRFSGDMTDLQEWAWDRVPLAIDVALALIPRTGGRNNLNFWDMDTGDGGPLFEDADFMTRGSCWGDFSQAAVSAAMWASGVGAVKGWQAGVRYFGAPSNSAAAAEAGGHLATNISLLPASSAYKLGVNDEGHGTTYSGGAAWGVGIAKLTPAGPFIESAEALNSCVLHM